MVQYLLLSLSHTHTHTHTLLPCVILCDFPQASASVMTVGLAVSWMMLGKSLLKHMFPPVLYSHTLSCSLPCVSLLLLIWDQAAS